MQPQKLLTMGAARSSVKYLGHVDALRGIAILGVMLVHTAVITWQRDGVFTLAFTGQRGVQLFYIISAFTLCLSLDSERPEKHPLSNFFIRRFFRIAPLFYLTILANIVLRYLAPTYSSLRDLGRVDVLLGFVFLNGIRPRAINSVVDGGWSIAVETTFYLILPFLFRYFNTVRRSLMLFVATAPILGFLSIHLSRGATDPIDATFFSFLWFPVEFPVFVLGILSYCIWKEQIKGKNNTSDNQKNLSLLLILASFMLYCAALPFTDIQLYFSSFLFVPLVLGLSIHSWPVLVNRFTRFIGKISYSLYLVHFFVVAWTKSMLSQIDQSPRHLVTNYIFRNPWGLGSVYLLLLLISVPICTLTWKYIELPGINLGRRLIAKREGTRTYASYSHPHQQTGNTPDAQF